ncbi:MAG: TetR/AcrR family transcriptional regulator, partial [Erysipelothrix sp.]|nr:TetR/AcrR family transcriptional regulator [Erysipelothrix sp.]
MTRKEKNNMTRQKIIDSAIIEFGTHSYKEASLN